jgi:hypothetical protein
MTLGAAAAAQVTLIAWCKACQHQVELEAAEMAQRYRADTSVQDWRERLVCSRCVRREVDMVVSGTKPSVALHPADGARARGER